MSEFNLGDPVRHSSGSFQLDGVFLAYLPDDRVKVEYVRSSNSGKIGTWQKKYCAARLPSKDEERMVYADAPSATTSVEEADNAKDHLSFNEQVVKAHKKVTASDCERQNQIMDHLVCASARRYGKTGLFKQLYNADLSVNKNELAALMNKHDDMQDASAYMFVDWAEGYNPQLEKNMKAEIRLVTVNGELKTTYVNDKNVDDMEPSDFLHYIGNAEASIDKLKKHKDKSSYAKQEAKRLKVYVVTLYNLLDDKFGE